MLNYWLNASFGFFNLGNLHIGDTAAKVLVAIEGIEPQYIQKHSYGGNRSYDSYTIANSIRLEIDQQTQKLRAIELWGDYQGKFAGALGVGDNLKPLWSWATTPFLSFDEDYLIVGRHQNLAFKTDWDEEMGTANKISDLLRHKITSIEIGTSANTNPNEQTYLLNWLEWFSHKRMPNPIEIPTAVITEFQKLCIFELNNLQETVCFETAADFCDEWIEYIPFEVVKSFYVNWLRLKPNDIKLWRGCVDKLAGSGYLLEGDNVTLCYELVEEFKTQLDAKLEQLKQKIDLKIEALQQSLQSESRLELAYWQKIQAAAGSDTIKNIASEIQKTNLPAEVIKQMLRYAEAKYSFY